MPTPPRSRNGSSLSVPAEPGSEALAVPPVVLAPAGWPTDIYDVVYADPPWSYYGKSDKPAAAAKHYPLMRPEDIHSLPVRSIMSDRSALFLWATGPRLDMAVETIRQWGLHYRGVAYVWVKTTRDGRPLGGQGVQPTFTKPTTEFVLAATTIARGRPFPIKDLAQHQVVLAARGAHSEKPSEVRSRIETLVGDRPRIELFARGAIPGWDTWGSEALPSTPTSPGFSTAAADPATGGGSAA